MSLPSNLAWIYCNLHICDIKGKTVLDVGSKNWDMTVRNFIMAFYPAKYIGIDKESGPDVDRVCPAEEIEKHFGCDVFDLVLCLESLEHIKDWKAAVHNMKKAARLGGLIAITTRMAGYPLHGYPGDYWRFDSDILKTAFSDFDCESISDDFRNNGTYIIVRKPMEYSTMRSLDEIDAYEVSQV